MATTIFLVNPFVGAAPPPPPPSYLLDTYSATAAYSLRQLKTGVTNVVRVRRSSDNSEQDFTATEVTDGTLTTWTGANDGFVTTWYDQSGNGNNAPQTTASNQPRLVNAGVLETKNGLPTVRFDNSNDYLYPASIGLSGSSLRSVFTVATPTSLSSVGGGYLGVGGSVTTGSVYDLCTESGRFALRVSGNSIYNTTINTTQQYLFSTLQTTTTTAGMNLFIDGASVSQTSTTSTTLNPTDRDWET